MAMPKAQTMQTLEDIILQDEKNAKACEILRLLADFMSGAELEEFLDHVKSEYGID